MGLVALCGDFMKHQGKANKSSLDTMLIQRYYNLLLSTYIGEIRNEQFVGILVVYNKSNSSPHFLIKNTYT